MFDDFVKAFYNPITDLYDRIGKWKQLQDDLATKVRLLYLECCRNLALLNSLNLSRSGTKAKIDDPDFLAAAAALEVEILEMIFFEGEKNSKFFKLLSKKIEMQPEESDAAPLPPGAETSAERNIIQAAVSLYISIATLKKVAVMPRTGKALKRINFRTRLANIRTNLLAIVKVLAAAEEIGAILRRT